MALIQTMISAVLATTMMNSFAIMKKAIKFVLIAAAVFSIAACEKEVEFVNNDDSKEIQLSFRSERPSLADAETKTAWDGTTINWSKGDNIRIGYTVNGAWQGADGASNPAKLYASKALSEDTAIAEFEVSASFTDSENEGLENPEYEFYGVYPSDLVSETNFTPTTISFTLPSEQTPAEDSFANGVDVMYATSNVYEGIPDNRKVDLTWHRIVSHAVISMRNVMVEDGETLESITIAAQDGADLTGQHTMDITNGTIALPSGKNGLNYVTVKPDNLVFRDGAVEFWFTTIPFTATELTFTVKTSKYTYVRTFTGLDLEFLGNARNTLSVNMKKADKLKDYTEDFTDGIGEDFTTSGTEGIWKAGNYNGAYYMKASAYISSQHVVAESWLLSPYLTILADDSALSFEHSIDTHFGTLTNEATVWVRTKGGDWTQLTDVTYPTIPESSYSDFEPSTSPLGNYKGQEVQIGFKYIGTETNSGAWEIAKFKVSNAEPKYYPSFAFTSETTAQVAFTATTVEFTYYATHLLSEPTVAVKAGSDAIIDGTPTIANGKVTVNVKANDDDEAKTATLVVSCEGVDNIPELVINQEAKQNLAPQTATIDFTAQGYSNAQTVSSLTQDPFTVTFTNGGTATAYYDTGTAVRVYSGGTLKVSSEYTITKIEIVGEPNGAATLSSNPGGLSDKVWTGSAKEVTFTAGTAKHYRFQKLNITYLGPASTVTTYSMSIANDIQNGTVTASPSSEIAEGVSVTLTITPDSGYELESLTVDGTDVTSSVTNDGKYTFTMPAHDVEVSATFRKAGSVTPGEEKTATIKSTWTGSVEQDLSSLTETDGDITALFEKKSSQNGIYHSTSQIRVYQDNTITLTGGKISKVVVTCSGSSYNKGFTTTEGSTSSSDAVWTWEGSSSNLVLTASGTSRITKIEVTYY